MGQNRLQENISKILLSKEYKNIQNVYVSLRNTKNMGKGKTNQAFHKTGNTEPINR